MESALPPIASPLALLYTPAPQATAWLAALECAIRQILPIPQAFARISLRFSQIALALLALSASLIILPLEFPCTQPVDVLRIRIRRLIAAEDQEIRNLRITLLSCHSGWLPDLSQLGAILHLGSALIVCKLSSILKPMSNTAMICSRHLIMNSMLILRIAS